MILRSSIAVRWASVVLALPLAFTSIDETASAATLTCRPGTPINPLGSRNNEPANHLEVPFKLAGISMKVPYGYFLGRTAVNLTTCRNDRNFLDFVFWFPDLAPPEKDPFNYPDWRPTEQARTPVINSFLVKIAIAQPIDWSAQFNHIVPEFIKPLDPDLAGTDLTSVTPAIGGGFTTANLYEKNATSEAIIDCYEATSVDAACKFSLRLFDISFSMDGYIPRSGLPKWKELKESIVILLKSWIDK
ncbi:hypothetical protein C8J35_1484 [Rhizobium sp. PP-F2F-G38]|nr:hypothetical protein C8J35_1484 [Rhizobium sp. PP-F2F-G38]